MFINDIDFFIPQKIILENYLWSKFQISCIYCYVNNRINVGRYAHLGDVDTIISIVDCFKNHPEAKRVLDVMATDS